MRPAYPWWITLPVTALAAVLVPVNWVEYGSANFLWFSNIALFAVVAVLWTGSRLIHSMMAVGVLPLELAWAVDFAAGGPLGIADYMFETERPAHLRWLPLYHLLLPPLLIFMLVRRGYDRRAAWAQTLFIWAVLPLSYAASTPEANINWTHSLGDAAEPPVPQPLYLLGLMALLPLAMVVPMHALLGRLFPRPG